MPAAIIAPQTTAAPSPTDGSSPGHFHATLSTVFTPPAACSGLPLTAAVKSGTTSIFRYRRDACFPQGYGDRLDDDTAGYLQVFSPGRCPDGYKTFSLSQDAPAPHGSTSTLDRSETVAICCPGGYSWPIAAASSSAATRYCLSELQVSTTGVVYGNSDSADENTDSDGEDSPPDGATASASGDSSSSIAPGTVYADAIQIRWKANDFNGTAQGSNNTDSTTNSTGLSKGSKISIGVIVPVVFLILLVLVLWFLLLRRRRQHCSVNLRGDSDEASIREHKHYFCGHKATNLATPVGGWLRGSKKGAHGTNPKGPSTAYITKSRRSTGMDGPISDDRRMTLLPPYEPAAHPELPSDMPVCPVELDPTPAQIAELPQENAPVEVGETESHQRQQPEMAQNAIMPAHEVGRAGSSRRPQQARLAPIRKPVGGGVTAVARDIEPEQQSERIRFLAALKRAKAEERERRETFAWMTSR